jgi:hypothetical protein
MAEQINFKYSTPGANVNEPSAVNAAIDAAPMSDYAKARVHSDVSSLGGGPFRGIKVDVEGKLGSPDDPGRTNFSHYNVEGQT